MCDVVGHMYVRCMHSKDTWLSSICRSSTHSSISIVYVGMIVIIVSIIIITVIFVSIITLRSSSL